MRLTLAAVVVSSLLAGPAFAGPRPVTVLLERGGRVLDDGTQIPRFGGGDRVWRGLVACVQDRFAAFQVDVVEIRPARGPYITALVGGRASQLGHDDRRTAGLAPYNGRVIPNALVHVFSQVGPGERDVAGLCAVAAHEIGHALGLDHSTRCGDLMSYHGDDCGEPVFVDAAAPCGTDQPRACANGDATQNSYRRLGALVGFRQAPPSVTQAPPVVDDPWDRPADTGDDDAWDDANGDLEDGGSPDGGGDDAGACDAPGTGAHDERDADGDDVDGADAADDERWSEPRRDRGRGRWDRWGGGRRGWYWF